jgi:hypothetical protein
VVDAIRTDRLVSHPAYRDAVERRARGIVETDGSSRGLRQVKG